MKAWGFRKQNNLHFLQNFTTNNMSSNSLSKPYTPTLMEKLLGKHYKWWYLVKYCFKANLNYLWDELFSLFYQFTGLLAVVIVFLNGNFPHKEIKTILTYLIIGNVFYALTNANIVWIIGNSIKDGKIANKLLLPSSYLGIHLSTSLSNCLAFFISQIIVLIPIILIFREYLSFSINGIIFLIFWSVITWLIRFFIELISGFLAFWTTEIYGSANLTLALVTFFSGALFPLDFLGSNFNFLKYLPFAFTFHHPMQIYLGKYSNLEIFYTFLGGLVWCIMLYFLAKLVFKMGLKKNESVGL
jgi:ABC-2 type transport system permease protein